MLEFTPQEKNKIQILQPGIDPDNFDDKGLPSDTHIVKYEVDNGIVYDAVRAYTMVDIFDTYHDKLKTLKENVEKSATGDHASAFLRMHALLFQRHAVRRP